MHCIDGTWPLTAATADFTDFDVRCELAKQGIFSVDDPAHRARRALQAHVEKALDDRYAAIGLDRQAEYRKIAAHLEGERFDGIWARSTKRYTRARRQLDETVESAPDGLDPNAVALFAKHGGYKTTTLALAYIAGYNYCLREPKNTASYGMNCWISPKGMVWSVPYSGHSGFMARFDEYDEDGDCDSEAYPLAEKAGWLHVSDRAIDHRCTPTRAQERALDRLGIQSYRRRPILGGDNRPKPWHVPIDCYPRRERTNLEEAA